MIYSPIGNLLDSPVPPSLPPTQMAWVNEKAARTNEIFEEIVPLAFQLTSHNLLPKGKKICKRISEGLDEIIEISGFAASEIEQNQRLCSARLIELEKMRTVTEKMIKNNETELQSWESTEAFLKGERDVIYKEYIKIEKELKASQAQVEKYRGVSKAALMDLIPGHGIVAAFKTGKPERAILGYSQVRGITYAIKKNAEKPKKVVEEKQRVLSDYEVQLSDMNEKISAIHNFVSNLQGEIRQIHEEQHPLESLIKLMGTQVSAFSHVQKSVDNLRVQYRFLRIDAEEIQDLLENKVFDGPTINQFHQDLLKTREQFNQIVNEWGITPQGVSLHLLNTKQQINPLVDQGNPMPQYGQPFLSIPHDNEGFNGPPIRQFHQDLLKTRQQFDQIVREWGSMPLPRQPERSLNRLSNGQQINPMVDRGNPMPQYGQPFLSIPRDNEGFNAPPIRQFHQDVMKTRQQFDQIVREWGSMPLPGQPERSLNRLSNGQQINPMVDRGNPMPQYGQPSLIGSFEKEL